VGGRPSASVAPAAEPAAGRVPATEEMEALAASIEVVPIPSPGKRGGASPIERRQAACRALGDRLVAEKLTARTSSSARSPSRRGARTSSGRSWCASSSSPEDSLVSFLSKQ